MATANKTKGKPKKKATRKKVVAKKDNFVPQVYKTDLIDPRKTLFEAYYTDPNSPTFGNALGTGIKVGFTPSYARNLLSLKPQWVCDIIDKFRNNDLIELARKNIIESLNMNVSEHAVGIGGHLYDKDEFGKKTIPVIIDNTKKMEIRNKTALFVAERMDPSFNKINKKDNDNPVVVDFKQVIIINPNGQGIAYNQTGAETIPSIREITR